MYSILFVLLLCTFVDLFLFLQYDSHTWTAEITGEYRACFSNEVRGHSLIDRVPPYSYLAKTTFSPNIQIWLLRHYLMPLDTKRQDMYRKDTEQNRL